MFSAFPGVPGVHWRDPDLHEVIEFLNNPNNVIKANAAAYLQVIFKATLVNILLSFAFVAVHCLSFLVTLLVLELSGNVQVMM